MTLAIFKAVLFEILKRVMQLSYKKRRRKIHLSKKAQ